MKCAGTANQLINVTKRKVQEKADSCPLFPVESGVTRLRRPTLIRFNETCDMASAGRQYTIDD